MREGCGTRDGLVNCNRQASLRVIETKRTVEKTNESQPQLSGTTRRENGEPEGPQVANERKKNPDQAKGGTNRPWREASPIR